MCRILGTTIAQPLADLAELAVLADLADQQFEQMIYLLRNC